MNLKSVKGQWTARLSLNRLGGKAHLILNWWPWDWTAINYIQDSWMSEASKYQRYPLISPKWQNWNRQGQHVRKKGSVSKPACVPKRPWFPAQIAMSCNAHVWIMSSFTIHSDEWPNYSNQYGILCLQICLLNLFAIEVSAFWTPLYFSILNISILYLSMYLSCLSSYRSVYPSIYLSVDLPRWLTLCKL